MSWKLSRYNDQDPKQDKTLRFKTRDKTLLFKTKTRPRLKSNRSRDLSKQNLKSRDYNTAIYTCMQ